MRRRCLGCVCIALLALSAARTALGDPSHLDASRAPVTREIPVKLPSLLKDFVPQYELVAPNGDIWLAGGHRLLELGLATGSAIVRADVHLPGFVTGSPVVGPDGEVWFLASTLARQDFMGEVTPAGRVREFRLRVSVDDAFGDLVSGSDGNIWFMVVNEVDGELGRVSPEGKLTVFPLSHANQVGAWYGSLVPAAQGGFWTNTSEPIGSLGPANLTRVSLAGGIDRDSLRVVPMALDSSGVLWGWGDTDGLLERVSGTSSHELNWTDSPSDNALDDGSLVLGGDGHLWFSAGFSVGSCESTPTDPVQCPPEKVVLGTVSSDTATRTWTSPYSEGGGSIGGNAQMVAGPDGQLLVLGRPYPAVPGPDWELFSTVLPSRPVMRAPRVHIVSASARPRTATMTLSCRGQAGLYCAGTIAVSRDGHLLATEPYALTPGLTGYRALSFVAQPAGSRVTTVVSSRDPDTGQTVSASTNVTIK